MTTGVNRVFHNGIAHAQTAISHVAAVKDDSNALAKVAVIGAFILDLASYLVNRPIAPLLNNRLVSVDTLIGAVQLPADINYFLTDAKKHVDQSRLGKVLHMATITVADTLGAVMFLDALKFIDLAKWGAFIVGKAPFLRPVVQIGLLLPTRVLIGASFSCLAGDAIQTLIRTRKYEADFFNKVTEAKAIVKADSKNAGLSEDELTKAAIILLEKNKIVELDPKQLAVVKRQATIELIWSIVMVASQITAIAATVFVGSIPGLVVFGIIAAGCGVGLVAFVHNESTHNKVKNKDTIEKFHGTYINPKHLVKV